MPDRRGTPLDASELENLPARVLEYDFLARELERRVAEIAPTP